MFRRSSICSNDIKKFYTYAIIVSFLSSCSMDPNLFNENAINKIPIIDQIGNKYIFVKPNDTLFSIAMENNTSVDKILEINKLSKDSKIFVGQKIIIDKDFLSENLESNNQVFQISLPLPKPRRNLNLNKPLLIWPVIGEKITSFGQEEKGIHNDGINILADHGSIVVSADKGEVVFVGFDLKGFGSIVLIKHKNGWISSYAHLSKILVKEGEWVKQGQQIGLVGNTGRVTKPQLYFQIRDAEKPINPENYFVS